MTTPHKHQALINAWAAGAQIQWRRNDLCVWLDDPNPRWHEELQYRVKSPHQALIDAHEAGDLIEVDHGAYWRATLKPEWNERHNYRVSPRSAELKELIAAHKAGSEIEMRVGTGGWDSCSIPIWSSHVEYRIKDKFADLKKAFSEGKLIEAFDANLQQFCVVLRPLWDERVEHRLCPRQDELKPVVQAHLKGEQIEFNQRNASFGWFNCEYTPKWQASHDYRVYDEYRALKEAEARGEVIELRSRFSSLWYAQTKPVEWDRAHPAGSYRISPRSAELRPIIAAHKAGKQIQTPLDEAATQWIDLAVAPTFDNESRYRVKPEPRKHQAVIDAYERGETVQCQMHDGTWHDHKKQGRCDSPLFSEDWECRIKQPHQEVRDAFAAGKAIQYQAAAGYQWTCTSNPQWYPDWKYRVKPEPLKSRRYVWANPGGRPQVGICDPNNHHKIPASSFVRWIDDAWVETEV